MAWKPPKNRAQSIWDLPGFSGAGRPEEWGSPASGDAPDERERGRYMNWAVRAAGMRPTSCGDLTDLEIRFWEKSEQSRTEIVNFAHLRLF